MNTRSTLMCLLVAAVMTLLTPPYSYAQDTGTDLPLEQAIEQLESAIQNHRSGESGQRVAEAAARLGFVMERDGLETSGGELALGNAYFISDDLGKAILHYRRGVAIDHSDATLQRNLAYARSFVEPTVPDDGHGVSLRLVLTWWKTLIDGRTLWIWTIAVLALASLLWTVRVFDERGRISKRIPLGLAGIGLIGIGLLGYHDWITAQEPGVVVVLPGTELYSGPGAGVYQTIYDGALGVGTEGVILEERGEWTNIRLSNNQSGWVLSDSISII